MPRQPMFIDLFINILEIESCTGSAIIVEAAAKRETATAVSNQWL